MYQYQYSHNNHNYNNNHSSQINSHFQNLHESAQLRSMSSMSTMNSEMDSSNFNNSTSSAQTSTNSSPYNYKNQHHLHQPSISEEGQESPDLMGTEFYSSDNIDHKNHAQNLRKSMIYSESFDSSKFQSVRDSIFIDNENNIATYPINEQDPSQEPTKLAMTNSPSFSALASILEKKTSSGKNFKPVSNLQSSTTVEEEDDDNNDDDDVPEVYHEANTFNNNNKRNSMETLTVDTNGIPYDMMNHEQLLDGSSPNLIQLDDTETNIPREPSFDSILPSPGADALIDPQFYQRNANSNHMDNDDIFKTPEAPQLHMFHNSSSLSQISTKNTENSPPRIGQSPKNYVSMVDVVGEVPEIINTPQLYKTGSNEDESAKFSPVQHTKSQPTNVLPKTRVNQLLTSPQYKQRSASLPVLAKKSEDIKPIEPPQVKKKNKFMAFFKSSKRSVSTSQVEQTKSSSSKPSPSPLSQPLQQPPRMPRAQQSSPNIPSSMSSHKLPKKSTSSTSLFDAFKRNKNGKKPLNQPQFPTASVSSPDIPNIMVNPAFKQIDNDVVNDNDDSFSLSSADSHEFNEDFNKLAVTKQRPTSQISGSGDVFPKSLNAQEVESIVSLERNRSVRSRHSTMSQQKISLTDAISSNAKEEGMYVTYVDKEPSIPDLSKSPSNSVLKKQNSMTSLDRITHDNDGFEYDFGEDFSTALEFDDIADNYNPEEHGSSMNDDGADDNEEDISKFMEFADFIDFGGDLTLNFDMDKSDASERSSPNLRTLRPPRSVSGSVGSASAISSNRPSPRLQAPLSTKPFNSPQQPAPESPLLESPILQSEPFQNLVSSTSYDQVSPALSPLPQFIHEQTSRPMSMSFKGLKAPAFSNNHTLARPALSSSSSFVSQYSSSRAPSVKNSNPNRRVVFSSKIVLYDAWNEDEYDRHPDVATCNQLTPQIAQRIKEELNELKREMEVHEQSQCYTHFY